MIKFSCNTKEFLKDIPDHFISEKFLNFIRHAPILDENENVIGIITEGNKDIIKGILYVNIIPNCGFNIDKKKFEISSIYLQSAELKINYKEN